MAVIATTNLRVINYHDSKLSVSGFPVEQWRFNAGVGYAAADTLVVTGYRDRLIKAVVGLDGFSSNLTTVPTTAVTMTSKAALAASTNVVSVDFLIIFEPR